MKRTCRDDFDIYCASSATASTDRADPMQTMDDMTEEEVVRRTFQTAEEGPALTPSLRPRFKVDLFHKYQFSISIGSLVQ